MTSMLNSVKIGKTIVDIICEKIVDYSVLIIEICCIFLNNNQEGL